MKIFEAQLQSHEDVDHEEESLSDSQEEVPVDLPSQPTEPLIGYSSVLPAQEHEEEMDMRREPQLCLRDDWIRPVEVMRKPGELMPHENPVSPNRTN